jgi:hypothetical protein
MTVSSENFWYVRTKIKVKTLIWIHSGKSNLTHPLRQSPRNGPAVNPSSYLLLSQLKDKRTFKEGEIKGWFACFVHVVLLK